MPLLVLIVNGIFAFTTVFIACELGEGMIEAFDEIDSTIDQLNWYLFPIEFQQILPMIIVNAQQLIEMECFGSIACTRDVFKNVRNNHKIYGNSVAVTAILPYDRYKFTANAKLRREFAAIVR